MKKYKLEITKEYKRILAGHILDDVENMAMNLPKKSVPDSNFFEAFMNLRDKLKQ